MERMKNPVHPVNPVPKNENRRSELGLQMGDFSCLDAPERTRTSTPKRAQVLNLLRMPFRHRGKATPIILNLDELSTFSVQGYRIFWAMCGHRRSLCDWSAQSRMTVSEFRAIVSFQSGCCPGKSEIPRFARNDGLSSWVPPRLSRAAVGPRRRRIVIRRKQKHLISLCADHSPRAVVRQDRRWHVRATDCDPSQAETPHFAPRGPQSARHSQAGPTSRGLSGSSGKG